MANPWTLTFEEDIITADSLVESVSTETRGESVDFEFIFEGSGFESRYQTVKNHCEYAGSFVTQEATGSGNILFREQHSGPSLLVQITPDFDIYTTDGIWGIIDGFDDATTQPDIARISLSVLVLAPAPNYASHDALHTGLAMRGP